MNTIASFVFRLIYHQPNFVIGTISANNNTKSICVLSLIVFLVFCYRGKLSWGEDKINVIVSFNSLSFFDPLSLFMYKCCESMQWSQLLFFFLLVRSHFFHYYCILSRNVVKLVRLMHLQFYCHVVIQKKLGYRWGYILHFLFAKISILK